MLVLEKNQSGIYATKTNVVVLEGPCNTSATMKSCATYHMFFLLEKLGGVRFSQRSS